MMRVLHVISSLTRDGGGPSRSSQGLVAGLNRDVSDITIDVFFHQYVPGDKSRVHQVFMRWYPDRKYPDPSATNALRFNFVAPKGIKKINVGGVVANVPENAEEILDSEYGPWRKPDPNFKSDSLKYEELEDYSYRILKSEDL